MIISTEFYGGKFTLARFADNTREHLEAFWEDAVTKETRVYRSEYSNPNDGVTTAILKHFTVEEIIANTKEHDAEVRRSINDMYAEIAKEQGLIYDPGTYHPSSKINIDNFFKLPEGNAGQQFLFELKKRALEQDSVSKSTNEYKDKIRNASSPLEVLYWTGKISYE